MFAPAIFLALHLSSPAGNLEQIGVPAGDAENFRAVAVKALSQDWPRKGNASALSFEPSKSNPALDGVLKVSGSDSEDFRTLMKNVDAGMATDGHDKDASYYLGFAVSIAMELESGKPMDDKSPDHIREQIAYALNAQGWSKQSSSRRTSVANVAKALLAVELIASMSQDPKAGAGLATSVLQMIIGEGNSLKIVGGYAHLVKGETAAPSSPATSLRLPEKNGFKSKQFGGQPGLTRDYPDYPNKVPANFILMPVSNRPWDDFMGAWNSVLPANNTGKPEQIPFKRYVGNGARAMMSYGNVLAPDGRRTNMLVFSIENGTQSQVIVGYYPLPSLLNQIVVDFEQVLASLNVPGAIGKPLTSAKDLVGIWTTKGASVMGYFSTSSGDLVGASVVDRNLQYTFRGDGTYSFEYQGVTGNLGSLKADEVKHSGTFSINGEVLTLNPKGRKAEKLSLRGVIPVGGKARVLLIGQVGRGFDSELYYIQKFVTK